MDWTLEEIARMIDHSLLNPVMTERDLEEGCCFGVKNNVASVCVMPYYLKRCAKILKGNAVKASTTIGFPHGGHATSVKVAEARQAITDGGEELDMVVNISTVLSGDWAYVRTEIAALAELTHAHNAKLKVIFENCYLQDEHKIKLCEICGRVEVDWVKTSTGYGSGGATDADLILMRKHSPPHVQIKAAGGIRDLSRLLAVRALGVTRVGASRTADILDQCRTQLQ